MLVHTAIGEVNREKMMSTHPRCKAVLLGLALTAAAVAFAPAAVATPVNYKFTVDVTSGPLVGTYNGTFSYDRSSVVVGGYNLAPGLLTALDFTFNGTTWNAGTANAGDLAFDSNGALDGFLFGNSCFAGACSLGSNGWVAAASPGSGSFFIYSISGVIQDFSDMTFAAAAVPEPGSLSLFGFGVLLLGIAARRRLKLRRAA